MCSLEMVAAGARAQTVAIRVEEGVGLGVRCWGHAGGGGVQRSAFGVLLFPRAFCALRERGSDQLGDACMPQENEIIAYR